MTRTITRRAELAHRTSDGIDVYLFWEEPTNRPATDPAGAFREEATTGPAGVIAAKPVNVTSRPPRAPTVAVADVTVRLRYDRLGWTLCRNSIPAPTPTAGTLAADLAAGTLPNYGLFIPRRLQRRTKLLQRRAAGGRGEHDLTNWMPTILASSDYTAATCWSSSPPTRATRPRTATSSRPCS
jgi:hypothetical protein